MKTKQKEKFYSGVSQSRWFKISGGFLLFTILAIGFFFNHKHNNKPKVSGLSATAQLSQIPDWWNLQYFGNSVCSTDLCKPDRDIDQDGLSNFQEFYYHTDPLNSHTIGDSLSDGELVSQGFDPSQSGRVKLSDSTSDDSILGESLLFDTDIKSIVKQSQDLSHVALPLPDDSQLNVIQNATSDNQKQYLDDINKLTNKYFPQGTVDNLTDTLKSSPDQGDQVKQNATMLSDDLKQIPVPDQFLTFHKYLITFYQLLSDVALGSDLSITQDPTWYDKAQQFFLVQQKLTAEKNLLAKLYPQ